MTDRTNLAAVPLNYPHSSGPAATRPPRVWPPLLLLAMFWVAYSVLRWTELGVGAGFFGFVILMGGWLIELLLIAVWWLGFSRVGRPERLLVVAAAVVGCAAAVALSHKSMYQFMFMGPGLPLVVTAWTLVLVVARSWPAGLRRAALVAALVVSWSAFPLLRTEGLGGDMQFALNWRWTPTAEQVYLAQRSGEPLAKPDAAAALTLQPGDWPAFRGPDRDGVQHDVSFESWATSPPKQLWKRRIGPAWSSVAVVGDRLFTQEQLGPNEAVVCLDAATGNTVWSQQDEARWDDTQSGPGPRATPTFDAGRVYALGATGILNCLDAATGDVKWTRNILTDSKTEKPNWGFSSSPLVTGGLVIVFAGGTPEKTLLAYHTDSGSPAWSAAAGKVSYVSPQLATVAGKPQVLFVSDRGLTAFDPATGDELWIVPTSAGNPGVPQATQPRVIGDNQVLFDAGADEGAELVEVAHDSQPWTATRRWVSPKFKPSFNDFVIYKDAAYGFDKLMFTCVDLKTGKPLWRGGRYGSGQVLLVTDPRGAQLVIVAENGDLVLVAADPASHRELARFPALKGKTWNHPVIAHGKLFVRNAEEIACYELPIKP
ncbi:MAG: PQQ-binding-like beta-propeller repeat protein [Gemmataceae bacterium]